MFRKNLIFGAKSEYSVEVQESCARNGLRYHLFDNLSRKSTEDLEVAFEKLLTSRFVYGILGLGYPKNKIEAYKHATELGLAKWFNLIDKYAITPETLTLGVGNYVNAGSTLGGKTTLGNHVTLNKNSTIGHHVNIGDFTYVSIGAIISGNVNIGNAVLIGGGYS